LNLTRKCCAREPEPDFYTRQANANGGNLKVNIIKPVFAVYGPVGHAKAEVLEVGSHDAELGSKVHQHLARYSVQGFIPSMFFNQDLSLEKQGYHILPVVNGEIDDALLASLPVPRCYQPAKAGEPGRRIAELTAFLPDYNHIDDVAVWNEGTPPEGSTAPCDHDFGLESYKLMFRHESGQIFAGDDEFDYRQGEFFNQMTCTRCGAVHAMSQR
jgi:hypothetical protein